MGDSSRRASRSVSSVGPREGAPHQHAELVVEEAEVEAGVVGDQHRVGRELDEARQHLFDRRLAGDHLVG